MMRFLAVMALALCLAAPAQAQRASRDLIVRYEAITVEVEGSTLNAALPLFADLFWGFRPVQVATPGSGGALDPDSASDPGIASRIANESLRRNLPAIERYVQTLCRRLTPQQATFLDTYAAGRYAALSAELAQRRAAMAGALGTPVEAFDPATIRFSVVHDCRNSASAGPGSIQISRELLLTALLSSLYVDSQLYIVPERTLEALEERVRGARPGVDAARAGPLLDRVRQTAVWKQTVRARQQLHGGAGKTLEQYEQDDMFASIASRPDCVDAPARCRLMMALSYVFLSANKFDLFFREQVDFIIAHEMGHHALGHVAQPFGSCAAERAIEDGADRFAVALTRPADGLFAPAAGSVAAGTLAEVVETRFASGLDLFMVQSHRIAGLPDGNGCQYPGFETRRQAARAFEEASYPRTRAQMARYATRSVAGAWSGAFMERGQLVRITAVLQDTPTGGFTGVMTERSGAGEFTSVITGRARANGQIAFQKTYDGKNGRNYGVGYSGHLLGPNTMAGQWRLADGTSGSFSFERQGP